MDKDSEGFASDQSDVDLDGYVIDLINKCPSHVVPLDERIKIENDFERELWALRNKYDHKFDPISKEMKSVIEKIDEKEEEMHYWSRVLLGCQEVSEFITSDDAPLMNYITDIRSFTITEHDHHPNYPNFTKPGLLLEFEFKENPYHKTSVLYKFMELSFETTFNDVIYGKGSPTCISTQGCTIEWCDNMNLTVEKVVKTQRHKKTNNIRKITIEMPKQSFFNFFKASQADKDDDQDDGSDVLGESASTDYFFAELVSNVVIRRSLQYFSGIFPLDHMDCDTCDEEESDSDDQDDSDEELSDVGATKLVPHMKQFGLSNQKNRNVGGISKKKPPHSPSNDKNKR